ncbi:MAG TPA: Crp/Fnr family transcriptional regulator [Brevundimonas sp.]|uniref:Crp/Fnr family transcriptional regulator n=1 Tax=Brevundimonas sp. TaxID=1871086 RepID=UPI002DF652DA|nr:Crp/Fnr family transcriptional regulator [Brevundimonas sp.]
MATYLIRKLERYARLSPSEKAALQRLGALGVRSLRPREDVVREGDRPRVVNIVLDGFACRYKTLEDGRRQIVGFFMPGDICDPRVFILKQMDHSIASVGPLTIAEVGGEAMIAVTSESPRIAQAMWWATMVEEAIAREWILNVGQRSAVERMAHLLCELFLRLRAVGLTDGQSCDLPMTQVDLADATGLSSVHVNRTVQDLRASGLIVWKGKRLTIPNLRALQNVGMFNPNYLHLDNEGDIYDANDW